MPVKVLGQTAATAATATTTLNFVKDPFFETLKMSEDGYNRVYSNAVSVTNGYSGPNVSPWTWVTRGGSSASVYTVINSSTSAYTSNNIYSSWGVFCEGNTNVSGQFWASQGLLLQDPFNYAIDFNNAFPVTSSTTYYWGTSFIANDTSTFSSATARVYWFTSSGRYITDNSIAVTRNSSWTRSTSSVASPASASFAAISVGFDIAGNNGQSQDFGLFTGVHFSDQAGTNTTFPNPATGTDNTLTAPFTGRLSTSYASLSSTATTSMITNPRQNSRTITSNAGAMVDLYTVPAGSSAVVSTVSISNASTSASTYRIAVVPSGETLALKHFVAFDIPIQARSTETFTIGMTLAAGDKIRVSSDISSVAFSAFGSEN